MAYAHDLISNNTTHLIHHFTEYIILFSLIVLAFLTFRSFFGIPPRVPPGGGDAT